MAILNKIGSFFEQKWHDFLVGVVSSRYAGVLLVSGAIAALSLVTAVFTVEPIEYEELPATIPGYTSEQRPLTSMAFIRRQSRLKFITCINNRVDENACDQFTDKIFASLMTEIINNNLSRTYTGSGAVISHDESRTSSYVISANHVCGNDKETYAIVEFKDPTSHTLIFSVESKLQILDYYGSVYNANVIRADEDNDICILATDNIMFKSPPVRVAKNAPEPGDRIYNVASPRSLSRPGAVLSYEGYFAGTIAGGEGIANPHYLLAIPTAPGSSGSIILNEHGEIVSIISYGYLESSVGPIQLPPHDMWPLASAGPTLEAISKIIAPRIIQ